MVTHLFKNDAGEWVKDPARLHFPVVFNMADVPDSGYRESLEFDKLFTTLVRTLHQAWKTGSQSDLDDASFSHMSGLTEEVINLMNKPIPNDPHGRICAPSFLMIPQQKQSC